MTLKSFMIRDSFLSFCSPKFLLSNFKFQAVNGYSHEGKLPGKFQDPLIALGHVNALPGERYSVRVPAVIKLYKQL